MSKSLLSYICAALLSLFVATVVPGPAHAESGSTGGTLGKSGKSVTGGGALSDAPRAAGDPNPARNGHSIAGKWTLTFICLGSTAIVEATFRQTSATTFSGTSVGLTSGYTTRIYDGRISGDRISWTRVTTNKTTGRVMQNSGRLTGNQIFDGFEKGPFWTCTFNGRKG